VDRGELAGALTRRSHRRIITPPVVAFYSTFHRSAPLFTAFHHFPPLSIPFPPLSITLHHFSIFSTTFHRFPPLSTTFHHFSVVSTTFHRFPPLFTSFCSTYHRTLPLSATFNHFPSLSTAFCSTFHRSPPLHTAFCRRVITPPVVDLLPIGRPTALSAAGNSCVIEAAILGRVPVGTVGVGGDETGRPGDVLRRRLFLFDVSFRRTLRCEDHELTRADRAELQANSQLDARRPISNNGRSNLWIFFTGLLQVFVGFLE